MKKLILITVLIFTLTSCDFVNDDYTNDKDIITSCEEGYTLVGQACELDEEDNTPLVPIVETGCQHLENIDDWQIVWCDEFDYTGLPDSEKWSYDVGGQGWGNNELQYYTDADLDNAHVEDGNLTITAIKEDYMTNDYTSARLITKNQGDWLYGKIQIKAKLPSGTGTWPAIWMLPTDWEYGGWPNSGEIDIMEHVGYDKNNVYSTIHTGAYNHTLGTQIGFEYYSTTLESEFHEYEIEWEPGLIKTYIDGIQYATFIYNPNVSANIEPTQAWPFDQAFHLILNIAVGGNWGGSQGVDTDIWPQEMVIDYVRVYQKDYITGDTINPTEVGEIDTSSISTGSAFIIWENSTDNMAVKEYEIYVDDELLTTQFHNAYNFVGLTPDTSYTIGIVALDFAGNKSTVKEFTFTTDIPQSITGRIEAEGYSSSQGINTESTTDVGGGENVGWTDNGDYLQYILNVEESGNYTVDFRLASQNGGGTFTFDYDDSQILSLTTPNTGDWQTWETITSSSIYLEQGVHTFTISFNSEGTNINYFEFKKVE